MSTMDLPPRVDNLTLHPFGSPQDWACYQALIDKEPHRDTDFYSAEELRQLIADGQVRAWMAKDGGTPVGWCAVMPRSPHHPLSAAVHLLGVIVDLPYRGQGFGYAMVRKSIREFYDRPITASVLPGNLASERMMARAGFRAGLMQAPWRTWHRMGSAYPMSLVEDEEQVSHLSGLGIYAEVTRAPTEGGEGRIQRGLWPDPAAFYHASGR